jgi:hypothetical protein
LYRQRWLIRFYLPIQLEEDAVPVRKFVAPDPFCSQSPGIKNSPVAIPEPGTVLLIFALSPLVLLARRFRAV